MRALFEAHTVWASALELMPQFRVNHVQSSLLPTLAQCKGSVLVHSNCANGLALQTLDDDSIDVARHYFDLIDCRLVYSMI